MIAWLYFERKIINKTISSWSYNRDTIEFNEIINYSLNLSDSTDFYNVESVKFFENDSSFYISLDPYDENETISDKDNDFILAQKILLVTEV